jgi:hypothetical protein
MEKNNYKANNVHFVSTSTVDDNVTEEKKWNIYDLYKSEFTVDNLVRTLEVIDMFKRKYPNDETIKDFEDIVREEICQLFGGTTIDID